MSNNSNHYRSMTNRGSETIDNREDLRAEFEAHWFAAVEAFRSLVDAFKNSETKSAAFSRKQFLQLVVLASLLVACTSMPAMAVGVEQDVQPSATATAQVVEASPTPEPTSTSTATPTETATATPEAPERVVIDLSDATLEHPINPYCVDQFPLNQENDLITVCFTFDNWVVGPIDLNDGYEIMRAAEGWYEQNGKQIPVLIPLAVANRDKNVMQLNGALIQSFAEFFYDGGDKSWESHIGLHPGDTLWVTIGMPTEILANNSTQGFGFEAAQYTEEDLVVFSQTGDPTILGNLIWPAIDIDGREQ